LNLKFQSPNIYNTNQTCKDFIQASKIHSELLFKYCSCYNDNGGVTYTINKYTLDVGFFTLRRARTSLNCVSTSPEIDLTTIAVFLILSQYNTSTLLNTTDSLHAPNDFSTLLLHLFPNATFDFSTLTLNTCYLKYERLNII
jgi:hypothetical protein